MFLSPCEEVPRKNFRDGKEELITGVIIYVLTQAPFFGASNFQLYPSLLLLSDLPLRMGEP
jgi:hypothetical protein